MLSSYFASLLGNKYPQKQLIAAHLACVDLADINLKEALRSPDKNAREHYKKVCRFYLDCARDWRAAALSPTLSQREQEVS